MVPLGFATQAGAPVKAEKIIANRCDAGQRLRFWSVAPAPLGQTAPEKATLWQVAVALKKE
jgi:hypothetical protein